jgi:hypothetical protein
MIISCFCFLILPILRGLHFKFCCIIIITKLQNVNDLFNNEIDGIVTALSLLSIQQTMVNRYRRANHVAALLWINLIFVLFLFDSLSFQCLCPES